VLAFLSIIELLLISVQVIILTMILVDFLKELVHTKLLILFVDFIVLAFLFIRVFIVMADLFVDEKLNYYQ
jgi:hypothetical protein